MMLDLAQNSPHIVKIPTQTIRLEKNKKKLNERIGPFPSSEKTHPHSTLQVPTTQLARMSIDSKFVELTADVLELFL